MDPRSARIGVALALTAAIIMLRFVFTLPSDGFLFLLIAPIALIAIEFSFSGGLVAALLAGAVAIIFKATGVMDYSSAGVAVRLVVFLIAGAGVGYLVEDRKRRETSFLEMERRKEEHHEGLEFNDEIVQGLAVAKLALEMGEKERAMTTLTSTLKRAQEIASRRLSVEGPLTRKQPGHSPPSD